MAVTKNPKDVLVTYSIGSSIAVSLLDRRACVGGMGHCVLPFSKVDPQTARSKPQMFVDTGVSALLAALCNLGAERERLIAKVAGGAGMLGSHAQFKVGARNRTILKEMLRQLGVPVQGEDTGGTVSRSMFLYMGTGKTVIRSCGKDKEL